MKKLMEAPERGAVPSSSPEAIDGDDGTMLWRLAPIRSQKVHVEAANQIIGQIKAGTWQPGSRLPSERELSDLLAISRTSVRQALGTLEAIGFVEARRGAGHYVRPSASRLAGSEIVDSMMLDGDPQELLEARMAVEPHAARLAAKYRELADVQRLEEVLSRMAEEEAGGLVDRYLDVDYFFHMALAYATHNPVVIDLVRVLIERMKAPPWRKATLAVAPKNYAANLSEHARIVDAVRARAPNKAREAMQLHLRGVARNLRQISSFGVGTEEDE